jgi:hypothetical protein
MKSWRRGWILAVAVAVVSLAACDAPAPASVAPTIAPSSLPSIAPTLEPSPTRAPDPTLAPLPSLTPGCSALDDVDLGGLEVDLSSVYPNGDGGYGGFSIGRGGGALQVTRVKELSGERRSATPPPRELSNDRGLMLGGREFVTYPSTWFDGHLGPQAMISARATLALEGASPIELPTRLVPGNELLDQVAVTVPDLPGRGTVTLDFAWDDACFRYEASGTIPVDIVALAETARCELDEDLYWDQLGALLDESIMVGGTRPDVGSPFNESKFAPYLNPGIDAFMAYMFDKDAPELSVASGSTVRTENRKPRRLDLAANMKVVIWTRRSIVGAIADYPPHGIVQVFEGRLELLPDGSYELPVPDGPGRYVAGLSVEFDSRCSTGTLWSVVNLATS